MDVASSGTTGVRVACWCVGYHALWWWSGIHSFTHHGNTPAAGALGLLFAALGGSARAIGTRGATEWWYDFWCLFTHPNAQFTIGFVVGLLLLAGRIRIHESLGILGLCAVFFAVRLLMMREGSYDDGQFDELKGYATHLSRFWDRSPSGSYANCRRTACMWPWFSSCCCSCCSTGLSPRLMFHHGRGAVLLDPLCTHLPHGRR